MTEPLMDSTDVALLLRKTPQWVEREARAKRLPHIKVGRDLRFTSAHVASYIESLNAAAAPPGNPWGRKQRKAASP